MGEETKDTKSLFLANAGQDTGAQDNNKREVIEPLAKVDIPQAKAEVQNPAGPAMPKQYSVDPNRPYGWLQDAIPYKQLTPEEIEKQKKREKQEKIFSAIGDGISALSNLYFASQGAPNAYDSNSSMSAKTKERWDKLNKMQQEQQEKGFEYRMRVAQLSQDQMNADRNFDFRKSEAERAAEQWKQTHEENKRQFNTGMEYKKSEAARAQANADRAYDEGVRQFNVTSKQTQTRLNQTAKQLARQEKEGKYTFALGGNFGTVEVPTEALNTENVAYLYSLIPEEKRSAQGKEISRTWNPAKKQYDVVYDKPSIEAMRIEIGTNISDIPALQDAICDIAGKKRPERGKKENPMGSTGKKANPMQ